MTTVRKFATGALASSAGFDGWAESTGGVVAVIASLADVDSDADTYEPGAFAGNDVVPMSVWNHGSWSEGPAMLPIGVGAITEENGKAVFRARFFATPSAQAHREVLRELGPKVEWSYGFDIVQSRSPSMAEQSRGAARVLQRLQVHEASPVLRGAGVGTQTLDAKGVDEAEREFLRYIAARNGITIGASSTADTDSDDVTREYLRFVRRRIVP